MEGVNKETIEKLLNTSENSCKELSQLIETIENPNHVSIESLEEFEKIRLKFIENIENIFEYIPFTRNTKIKVHPYDYALFFSISGTIPKIKVRNNKLFSTLIPNSKLFFSINFFSINNDGFAKLFSDTNNLHIESTRDRLEWGKSLFENYHLWVEKYLEYIHQNNQKTTLKKKSPKAFGYALKHFLILDFQCIQYIEEQLPVNAQFIVFAGENGDGKTSILQALSLGFYNSNDLPESEIGRKDTVIHVQYKSKDTSFHNEIYNNPYWTNLYALQQHIAELKPFAAYGASRLKVLEKAKPQNPLLNLNTDKAQLINIFESWLRDISVNEPEKFTEIKKTLLQLLPHISDIVKKDESKIISDFVFIEKGNRVDFEHLSAGHKSIVLMVGDMLMRLSEAQPEIQKPSDLAGIVLIDELEAHLHPKWQKEFPKILCEIFPKVQFIVTTHSAVCLLGMPENTVFFKVKRSETEGTQLERLQLDIKNLLPNQILTSPIFDLDILPVSNENVSEIDTAPTYQETERRKNLDDKLSKLAKKLQK